MKTDAKGGSNRGLVIEFSLYQVNVKAPGAAAQIVTWKIWIAHLFEFGLRRLGDL